MSFRFGARPHLPLIGILSLALALRLWGITFPSFHPDEKNIVQLGMDMLKQETLEPGKMNYGSLPLYLQTFCFWVLEWILRPWRGELPVGYGNAIGAGRMISVVSSVLSVYLTHQLTQLMRHSQDETEPSSVGPLAASAALAVSFVAVQCAHYATVDSLAMALVTAGMVQVLRFYHVPSKKHALQAGFLIGLATATKYTTVLASVSLALVPLLMSQRPRPWRVTLLGLGVVPLSFLMAMPYALLRYDKLLKAVEFESHHYRTGGETIFAMGDHTAWWNLEFLFYTGMGPGLLLMALFGIFYRLICLRTHTGARMRAWCLPLIYMLIAFAFLSRYTVRFDRNLLPILPILCAFAGLWVEAALQLTRRFIRPMTIMALTFALLYPLSRGVVFGMELQKPHTKAMFRAWKKAQPAPLKLVEHGRKIDHPIEHYLRRHKEYLVMSSHSLEPIAAQPDRFPILYRQYCELFAASQIVATFRNPWFDSDFFAPHHLLNSATVNAYHGPTLWVLKLPTLEEWNARKMGKVNEVLRHQTGEQPMPATQELKTQEEEQVSEDEENATPEP